MSFLEPNVIERGPSSPETVSRWCRSLVANQAIKLNPCLKVNKGPGRNLFRVVSNTGRDVRGPVTEIMKLEYRFRCQDIGPLSEFNLGSI